jgi:hypothetical protein
LSVVQCSSNAPLPPSVQPSFASSCLNAPTRASYSPVAFGVRHHDADPPHATWLLRARRERPRRSCAAERG